MTNDTATKIAAMVAELGRLGAELSSEGPSVETQQVIADVCSPENAAVGAHIAVSTLLTSCLRARGELDPRYLPSALMALLKTIATSLSLLHREAASRKVGIGEVLRVFADQFDREDKVRGGLDALLDEVERITGVKPIVVRPPAGSTDGNGGSKPGAN